MRMAETGSDVLGEAAFAVTIDGMAEVKSWFEPELSVYASPEERKLMLANHARALRITEQIAEAVRFFHPESGDSPGGCVHLVRRFFRRDEPDMPAFALGSTPQRHWRFWYAAWSEARDPRQYVAHAALVLLSVLTLRSGACHPVWGAQCWLLVRSSRKP